MVPYSTGAAMGAAGKEQHQNFCVWIPFLQHKEIRTQVMFLFNLSPLVGSAMAEEAMSCHLHTAHTVCPRHKGGSRQNLLEGLPLHTLGCRLASSCTLAL